MVAKREVAVAGNSTALATIDDAEDFAAFGNLGYEHVTSADLLIPRLTILQKMSPQIDESNSAFIEGAKYGDFCDTGTGEIWKTISVVPVYMARIFLEWAPRSSKKGLVANHGMDASVLAQCTMDERRRHIMPNGNYIAETMQWFVLNLSANGRKSFIPMTSTQLKHSRGWLTKIQSEKIQRGDGTFFTPAPFYREWIATTKEESNNDGSWKSWSFAPGRRITEIDPTKQLLNAAKEFAEQARDGLAKGDLSSGVEEHAAETNDRM